MQSPSFSGSFSPDTPTPTPRLQHYALSAPDHFHSASARTKLGFGLSQKVSLHHDVFPPAARTGASKAGSVHPRPDPALGGWRRGESAERGCRESRQLLRRRGQCHGHQREWHLVRSEIRGGAGPCKGSPACLAGSHLPSGAHLYCVSIHHMHVV